MRFIAGTITGVILATVVTTMIILGPYNVASSVAAFIKYVQKLAG